MFTGIVTDVGRVATIVPGGTVRFEIETVWDADAIDIGASIACGGPCLTVVARGNGRFAVDVSNETLAKTTLGRWKIGSRVNLERALRFGDELGGHLVSGHVDGVGKLVERHADGDSERMTFELPAELARFVAQKGSITIDGVSLTVNEVDNNRFGVNLIPLTLRATTLGDLTPGDGVNLEVDLLARYVERLLPK
ncbi:riboflavin synthase [Roseiterribacter gracilis]|uniref:Riboflavin synthase n=1 Tax=Roseiterribacter gracilis TaxID=2812848 RepID=A0A8S8XAJ4_9PROT|nr:riboflavin synthase subunit alpha [Rhodospirillales bacterium TMPK1]